MKEGEKSEDFLRTFAQRKVCQSPAGKNGKKKLLFCYFLAKCGKGGVQGLRTCQQKVNFCIRLPLYNSKFINMYL